MRLPPAVRIDPELYADAEVAGSAHGRSAAAQLTYWARVGQELERSTVPRSVIDRLAQNRRPYDSLGADEQAERRTDWAQSMNDAAAGFDLASEFREAGRSWSEQDEAGTVLRRGQRAGQLSVDSVDEQS